MNQASDMSALCIDQITKTLPSRQSEPISFSLCYAWNSSLMFCLTEHPYRKYKVCDIMDFKQFYGFFHFAQANLF